MKTLIALALFGSFPIESYVDARFEAERLGKPLVVGVGVNPPAGDWVSVRVENWHWGSGKFVVVYGADLKRRGDLLSSSAADVQRLLNPPAAAEPSCYIDPLTGRMVCPYVPSRRR